MAATFSNQMKKALFAAWFAADDIRVLLIMDNAVYDPATDIVDADTLSAMDSGSGIRANVEYDDSTYTTNFALASEAAAADDTADEGTLRRGRPGPYARRRRDKRHSRGSDLRARRRHRRQRYPAGVDAVRLNSVSPEPDRLPLSSPPEVCFQIS